MKTKIVEYLSGEAFFKLQEAKSEIDKLRGYPALSNRHEGAGLDLCVLSEKVEAAIKLINLLQK